MRQPAGGRLTGDRVLLRPVEPYDLHAIMAIANDPELRALTGGTKPMSRADAEEWLAASDADPARLWFAIVVRESGRVIGEAGLLRVFPEWRTADMSVMIGDRGEWAKGYGTEAARLLIDHAFGPMGLHRLAIGVVGFNERALGFWESLGFVREGVQRDGYLYGGRYHDFVMMSLLEGDARQHGATGATPPPPPRG
jgi:diamine N-acetyltransferase